MLGFIQSVIKSEIFNCVELFSVSNSKNYILIICDFLWNISLTLSTLLRNYFSYEFVGVLFRRLKTFLQSKFCQTISKRPLLTDENIQAILKFTISKPLKRYFKKNKKKQDKEKICKKSISCVNQLFLKCLILCVFISATILKQ